MKKIGVVLSGCGVYDGSEIHEAVLTLLAIDRNGAEAICMAPDAEFPEIDHMTMGETGSLRNALIESARIARGKIRTLQGVKATEIDALVFPGGFGAAKNLSDFAKKGAAASVNADVARLLREVNLAGKPIGAICIAPVLIAAILGKEISPTITIGNDDATAAEVEKCGAIHQLCDAADVVVDTDNRIVSTPAYMLAGRISEVADGIDKCIREVIRLA